MNADIKIYIEMLKEHKRLFVGSFLVFLTISTFITYMTQRVYESYSSIEIMRYQTHNSSDTIANLKSDARKNDPKDESQILLSSYLVLDTLKALDMQTHFYEKNGLKKRDIDANAFPFEVSNFTSSRDFNKAFFKISNFDADSYQIDVDLNSWYHDVSKKLTELFPSLSTILPEPKMEYHKRHYFNELVETENFTLRLSLKDVKADHEVYYLKRESLQDLLVRTKRNLSVHPIVLDSSIIEVRYRDVAPQRTQAFVTQLLEGYMLQNIQQNTLKVSRTIELIKTQLEEAQERLAVSERNLERFRKQNLLFDTHDKMSATEIELRDLEREYREIGYSKKVYEDIAPKIRSGEGFGDIVIDDESIMKLIVEYENAKTKRQELSTTLTPKHPDILSLEAKIATVHRRLKSKLLYQLETFNERQKAIKTSIKKLNRLLKVLPEKDAKLSNLQRRFDIDSQIYTDLLAEKSKVTTQVIKAQNFNRILDSASLPNYPIKPKKLIYMMIGMILAAIGAFVVILIRNYFDVMIKKAKDISRRYSIPVFGVIPYVESSNYNKIYVLDEENSASAEAFRQVRVNLEYSGNNGNENSKVILVTSSVMNEGKTTFAANLAVTQAMLEKRVIIINLDLRLPQLHQKFELDNTKGLSEVLAGKVRLQDAIQSYKPQNSSKKIHHLDIITSGVTPPNPSELLESERLNKVLEALRQRYDYIIIDSAPLLNVSDTHVLTKKADVILFVLKSEFSKYEYLDYIEKFVKQNQLPSVGVVLTAVKQKYLELPKCNREYGQYMQTLSKECR